MILVAAETAAGLGACDRGWLGLLHHLRSNPCVRVGELTHVFFALVSTIFSQTPVIKTGTDTSTRPSARTPTTPGRKTTTWSPRATCAVTAKRTPQASAPGPSTVFVALTNHKRAPLQGAPSFSNPLLPGFLFVFYRNAIILCLVCTV